MTAYRRPPPPPKWNIVYRPPFRDRLRRGSEIVAIGGVTFAGLALLVGAFFAGGVIAFALGLFGAVVCLSGAVFLTIVWMTRQARIEERTIVKLSGDAHHCRVMSDGERWTLPVSAEKLRVGQVIRVRFRDVAPESDLEPGREILEVRAIDD